MNIVKIVYRNGLYYYDGASNSKIAFIGLFLVTDVGCYREKIPFRDWALADKEDPNSKFGYINRGDATAVKEGEDGFIYISYEWIRFDEISESNSAKMSQQQFVQLLDDWQEKICKSKPKEVFVEYENNQFTIETETKKLIVWKNQY